MKQIESKLDAIEIGMLQNQEQMDDYLGTLELGIQQTQKEISRSRSENATNLDRAVNGIREEFAGLSQ